MADNVAITAGSGTTVAADEVTDGTLGTVKVQFVKIMDGTLDGTTKAAVGASGLVVNNVAALDKGSGTGGSATQRVIVDSSQISSLGRATPAASAPVVQASQTYETVAASQTAQVLGGSGATGDYIDSLLVIPATTSPGNVLLIDNATSITVFAGGASSVLTLIPFTISLGMVSASGAWKVTTGTNVSVIGIGNFT